MFLICVSLRAQPKSPEPADSPASIRFTDIAPRSDFDYQTNNNFTGRKYFPQPMCGGVAIFDSDGRQDIFFTNGAKLPELKKVDSSFHSCLLRNLGDDRFGDVTEPAGLTGVGLGYSFGVAAGDYDNDGCTDLFIANAGPNALYRNQGDGTFSNVTVGSGLDTKTEDLLSVDAAWFDYNQDSLLDLVVSHYTYWNPSTDKPCYMGDGTKYYCNLGQGKFKDVSREAGFTAALGKGMGLGIADFNSDGRPDVFVANDTVQNFLYVNQGDGTFKEASLMFGVAYNTSAAEVSGMGADAKDFNNDGLVDLFYPDLNTQHHALFQNENGRYFEYASPRTQVAKLSRKFSGLGQRLHRF